MTANNSPYTADTIHKMILNKRLIIDARDHGSYGAADLLMDCEIYEKRCLSAEQREIIWLIYVRQLTVKQAAHILNRTCADIKFILRSIPRTLEKCLP